MATRTRRDEVAALLLQRDREGLTYAELSERSGLAASTLSWWNWRLRREPTAAAAGFAELMVVEADGAEVEPAGVERHAGLRVTVGDAMIEVDAGFDARTLERLVSVLRRC